MPRAPRPWHSFYGQQRVIKRLKPLIAGAKMLGQACPSLLFVGPHGVGKTEFARTVAAEYGGELHYHQAGPEMDLEMISAMVTRLKHGDVLFLDEIHSLKVACQEALYPALDERKIAAVGKDAGTLVSLSEFTLIGATTWPSRLAAPFRSRLIKVEFEPYTFLDLRAIAEQYALEKGAEITGQAASLFAETAAGSRTSSAGTPRAVRKLVEEVLLNHPAQKNLGLDEVQAVFTRIGIRNGLWPIHREYLSTLHEQGGTCSLERLSIRKDRRHIMEEVEPILILQGLVEVSDRGRVLTAKGTQALGEINGERDGLATGLTSQGPAEVVQPKETL